MCELGDFKLPLYKICLLGDGGVGKTSLRERFLGKGFQSGYILTIGADFAVQDLNIDGQQYKFQIWDLAGQQRFSAVRALYYKGSHGAILVFDNTRPESLYNLGGILDQFIQSSLGEITDIPFDIKYLNTSAKTGLNVTEAFESLGRTIKDYISVYKERQ
jgi:GTPase SAR1 family protein